MSGVSGLGSTSNSSSNTPQGTLGDVAPVSFPGISSGIDYNAIIEKLTSLTLAQNQPLTTQANNLTAQNTELVKINGLIQKVQQAIMNLGDPTLFSTYSATSSNTGFATAAQTSGAVPFAGTTTILSQTLATATQITSDPAANKAVSQATPLSSAGFQITPTNGSPTASGKITVNGTQISYDVGTDTVTTILAKLNAISGIKASFQNDQLTITSTGGTPLSLGSASDLGNLEQIFKLDVAPILSGQQEVSKSTSIASTDLLSADGVTSGGTLTINGHAIVYTTGQTVAQLESTINSFSGLHAAIQGGSLVIETTDGSPLNITGDTGNFQTNFGGATPGFNAPASYSSVTSASNVGGVNPATTLINENTSTAVNTGTTFTINGVGITFKPATQNLQDVINEINSSNAGVTATWNVSLGQLQLVAKKTGPQSIVLGAPGDSSNFLKAFGLESPASPTTTIGTQASVTYKTSSGGSATVYSYSNQATNVIPGVTLSLLQSTTTPYTVTVAASNGSLVKAIDAFVTAYNAAVSELNSATAPPVVKTHSAGTPLRPGQTQSSQVLPGGVLFSNNTVQGLKDQLVNLVSGLVDNGSTSYNSFASIGLQLDNSVAVLTADSTSGNNNTKDSSDSGGIQTQTFDGTSGKLQPLDTTTLDSALLANPNAVQSIFTGSSGILAGLGSYLTFVTGTPTQLGPNGSFLGTAPDTALLSGLESANSTQIDSINQQISMVNDMAIAQANQLRAQFTASETLIAQLQAEQQSLGSLTGASSSGGSA